MSSSVYLLDANVFIQSAKGYYALDLAPSFWDAILENAAKGHLQSIDRVKIEIDRQKDELQEWTEENFRPFFQTTERQDVLEQYRRASVGPKPAPTTRLRPNGNLRMPREPMPG